MRMARSVALSRCGSSTAKSTAKSTGSLMIVTGVLASSSSCHQVMLRISMLTKIRIVLADMAAGAIGRLAKPRPVLKAVVPVRSASSLSCQCRSSPIAVIALGTGMRRGELCALRWQDVNLDAASLRVERSLEQTRKSGLRFKAPKSTRGRRTISLSPAVVAELRKHWAAQQERRLSLGLGGSPRDGLVFAGWDGSPWAPDRLSDNFA